jgi:hypothetical protein
MARKTSFSGTLLAQGAHLLWDLYKKNSHVLRSMFSASQQFVEQHDEG